MPPAHAFELRAPFESDEVGAGGIVGNVVRVRPLEIAAGGSLHAVDGLGFAIEIAPPCIGPELVFAFLETEDRVAVHAKGVPRQSRGKRIVRGKIPVDTGEHETGRRRVCPEFLLEASHTIGGSGRDSNLLDR